MINFASGLFKSYCKAKGREIKKERLKAEKQLYKKIWETEGKPHYEKTQRLFNKLCKEGKIKSKEQGDLRRILEKQLGGYVEDYKKKYFKNEFHRIYTYMKCWHLKAEDFKEIDEYLLRVQIDSLWD